MVRLAGGLLAVVGMANFGLGIVGLVTEQLSLTEVGAVALVVAGAVTVALGVLVALARRWAMMVSLVLFGGLFAVQAFGATGGSPAPAAITLAIVVVPLVLALRSTED